MAFAWRRRQRPAADGQHSFIRNQTQALLAKIASATLGVGLALGALALTPAPSSAASVIYVVGGASDPGGSNEIARVEAYNVATDTWTARADLSVARTTAAAAVAANGKLYVVGGWNNAHLNSLEEYDPATNSWTTRAPMPTVRSGLKLVAAPNGKLYAVGGLGGGSNTTLNTVEEYDPATDTWTARASMPTARHLLAAAAAANGKLYAVGGVGGGFTVLNTVEEYDPVTDTWTARTPMPTVRFGLGMAAAANGKLYAVGGGREGPTLTTVEEYDPVTDAWTARAPMSTGREDPGLAAADNGRLYVTGGRTSGDPELAATTEEYNPATDSWTSKASMPGGARWRMAAAATPPVVVPTGPNLLAVGGFTGGDSAFDRVEAYNPATNSWIARAVMETETGRDGPGVALASNGKLYVAGGRQGQTNFASVEEYDPATNTWTAKAPMPTARAYFGLTAAANGKLYAVGGLGSVAFLSTVEEYDPATNTWTPKASMPTARRFLALTAAANGKLYAVGGENNSAINAVEEYDPATNSWAPRTAMPTPRFGLALAAATNGKLYAVGGFNNSNLATVEEYDPVANTWAGRASMGTARLDPGLAALDNGKLYVMGGSFPYQDTVEEYDPATNTWTPKASMPGGGRARLAAAPMPPFALSVTVADSPDPVNPGSNLTYTITVTNSRLVAGPAAWSDTLPAGATFVSLPAVAGWSCTTPAVGNGGTVSCSRASFAAGASAQFTLTVAVGASVTAGSVLSNTVTVTPGDLMPADDSATATTTVKRNTATAVSSSPNPSVEGSQVTFTATVSASNGTPTGTVTFTIDGTDQSPVALSGGQAQLQTSSLSVGDHTVSASYGGDANFIGSSGTLAGGQTVESGVTATSTTVSSATNPSVFGQSVTFTATVSESAATGTVTFMDGATSLGTGSLSSGTATFSTTALTVGAHAITAVYGGDDDFTGSTSNAITQTVDKGETTTTVAASPATAKPGQEVSITATVAVTAPANGTPTGSITFRDGAQALGTRPIVNGKATLKTSALTIGSHAVSARFAATATLKASTGSANASVDPRIGPEFRVNTQTAGAQHQPSVARLAGNSFVIAWTARAAGAGGYDIHGQRYNAAGTKLGGAFAINTRTASNQTDPSVAATADGGFAVLWRSAGGQPGAGIYGQRYSESGQKAGREFRVVINGTKEIFSQPAVVGLNGGDLVVAFVGEVEDGTQRVYARRYNGNDTQGELLRVSGVVSQKLSHPAATALADGGFVVTWKSENAGPGDDIHGRRYTAAGKPGAAFRVDAQMAAGASRPTVAGLPGGGFIVAWDATGADGSGAGIYARRFANNGAAAGAAFRANTTTIDHQTQPSVASFADGGFMVMWTSQDQDGSGQGVYGQVYDDAGTRENIEFRVNTTVANNQSQPSASALAAGNFVVTWASRNQDGSLEGVYGQRFQFRGFQ